MILPYLAMTLRLTEKLIRMLLREDANRLSTTFIIHRSTNANQFIQEILAALTTLRKVQSYEGNRCLEEK